MEVAKAYFEVFKQFLQTSSRTTMVIVFLGLMLDNLLLTVVVPILPGYLYKIDHPQQLDTATDAQNRACLLDENGCLFRNSSAEHSPFIAQDLVNENTKVGLLFSSKAFVQLLINPCVGVISGRYGYTVPMFFGLCVVFLSSILFALGSSYTALFFARSIQGIGSSALVISGMGLISSRYPDDTDRSKNMGVALSGIAAGVLVGYPFGSIIYDLTGKTVPFVLIALLIAFLGGIQLIGLPPRVEHGSVALSTSTKTLLQDPYIIAVTVTICISTSAMAILEPCLPLWLLETMSPKPWQVGTAFVPDSIGYFIGSSFFGVFALRVGRWRCSLVAMIAVGISAICIPFATAIWHLILPHFGLGIGIGIVDASFMPLLAMLVDIRHEAVYGSVFAIAQIAVCLAYSLGPLLGGLIANSAGFPFLMRGIGFLNLLLCPVCLFLRHIPSKPENEALINHEIAADSAASTSPDKSHHAAGYYYQTLPDLPGDTSASTSDRPPAVVPFQHSPARVVPEPQNHRINTPPRFTGRHLHGREF